jgi:hypothetical protein
MSIGPPQDLKPEGWYWVRRDDGSLAPYRFHRVRRDAKTRAWVAEMFVGSFIQTFPLSRIVAEAKMPGAANDAEPGGVESGGSA